MKFTHWVKQHELIAYFLLTYLISWTIDFILIFSYQGKMHAPMALYYLVLYGPFFSSVIVTTISKGSNGVKKLLGRLLRFKIGMGWLLICFFPVLFFLVYYLVLMIAGSALPDISMMGKMDYIGSVGFLGALLIYFGTYGIGEETGWRGFALPRLQSKFNALQGTVILWIFWAIWHWPFFLYRPDLMTVPIIGYLLGMFTGAIVFTSIFNSTEGSVFYTALFHATYNFISVAESSEGTIAAAVTIAIIVLALVAVFILKPKNLSNKERQVI